MENAELTSQLAQMSTVSGIEKLNCHVVGPGEPELVHQVLQAASLIGYNVLSPGDTSAREDGKDRRRLRGTTCTARRSAVESRSSTPRAIPCAPSSGRHDRRRQHL